MVLFFSGYSDRYYKPMPEGRRYAADPLDGKSPAWPGPDPDCMEYLASRKVMTLGIDSTSMGPIPDLAEPTHFAGLKHGMIWAESATDLGQLPPTGAFYCMLGPKYAGGIYSEGRAFAIVGDPLARRLIDSARKRNVVDLSVVLAEDRPVSWPGRGVGNHRQLFTTIRWGMNPNTRLAFEMHMLDGQAGTHLVPPAYTLPPSGFDNATYSPEVKTWLAEYEAKYGRRGTSDVTTDKVPIFQTCGPARVIDVTASSARRPKKLADLAGDHSRIASDATRPGTVNFTRAISSSSTAVGATDIPGPSPRARPAWTTRSMAGAKAGRHRDPMRSSTLRTRGSVAWPPTPRHWVESRRSER